MKTMFMRRDVAGEARWVLFYTEMMCEFVKFILFSANAKLLSVPDLGYLSKLYVPKPETEAMDLTSKEKDKENGDDKQKEG